MQHYRSGLVAVALALVGITLGLVGLALGIVRLALALVVLVAVVQQDTVVFLARITRAALVRLELAAGLADLALQRMELRGAGLDAHALRNHAPALARVLVVLLDHVATRTAQLVSQCTGVIDVT